MSGLHAGVGSFDPDGEDDDDLGSRTGALAGEYAEKTEYRYLAFISYGTDAPGREITRYAHQILAEILRQSRREGDPETDVFIDRNNIAVGDVLESKIYDALDDSKYLIIVASKRSRRSIWVPLEVDHWIERHGKLDRVFFVVLDPSQDNAESVPLALQAGLPDAVSARFPDIDSKLVADLTRYHPKTRRILRDNEYLRKWEILHNSEVRRHLAQLAAPMLGIDVRKMVDEDVLAQRRSLRRRNQVIAALVVMVLLVATGAGATFDQWQAAKQQRLVALQQRDVAVATSVATQAENLASTQPNLAKQLALTAYGTAPTQAAAQASVLDTAEASGLISLPTETQVGTLAASPDGRLLAAVLLPASTEGSGNRHATLDLWDLRTHRLDWTFDAIENNTPIAFSHSGDMMAVIGNEGGIIQLFNVANPNHPVPFDSFDPDGTLTFNAPTSLALSPDGRTLAVVSSSNQTIWLWDVANPAHPVQYTKPAMPSAQVLAGYNAAVFTPDGSTLVLAGTSGELSWWDVRDPRDPSPLATSSYGTDEAEALAISPDGRTVGVATGSSILLWDTTNPADPLGPRTVPIGSAATAGNLAFSPDGTVLATAAVGEVTCWTVTGPGAVAPLTSLPDPGVLSTAVAFGADGDTVLAGNNDGTVASWQLPADRGAADIPADGVADLAFSPNGKLLAGADSDQTVWLWDASDPRRLKVLGRLPVGASAATAAAFAPGGSLLATGAADGTVRLWDLGQPSHAVMLGGIASSGSGVTGLAFDSADGGGTLAVAQGSTVTLWNVADPRKSLSLGTIPAGGTTSAVEFAPSGRQLALVGGGTVELWDVADPHKPTSQSSFSNDPTGYDDLAYSPDGQTLACAGSDGVIHLWDVAEPTRPADLADLREAKGESAVAALAYSADGSALVAVDTTTGADTSSLGVWSVGDPRDALQTGVLPEPGSLGTVAIDPVGGYAAAAGQSGAVLDAYYQPSAAAASICATVGSPITSAQWHEYVPDLGYAPPCGQSGAAS